MHQAIQDMARCEGHVGDQWMGCGSSTVDGVCNVCCADGGCNYGTCEEIRSKNILYVAVVVLGNVGCNVPLPSGTRT